jgi:MATE family multidrug resistance protein
MSSVRVAPPQDAHPGGASDGEGASPPVAPPGGPPPGQPSAAGKSGFAGRPGIPALTAEALDDDRTIRRLVFNLAWPVIVENLLQTAVGVVDLLMVSQLGAAAIAGVGVSVQVLFVVFAAMAAIGTGTTVLVSRFTGAREPREASRVLKQSIIMGIGLGVLLALIGVPGAKPLVRFMGAAPEVVEAGGAYLEVVFLTAVALTLSFIVGAAMRGAGDSRTPMVAALVINAVNVVASFVLIFGHLGLPPMGVLGSAWGAAIGRFVGLAVLLVLLARGATRTRLELGGGWLPDVPLIRRLLRVGLPSMGEQLSRSLGMLLFSTIVIALGTAVFAAQRISFNLVSLSFLPGFGFSMAATALTGQALGAGKPDRARRATWFATRSAMLWMGSVGVLFLVAAEPMVRAFTNDPEILANGSLALRVLALGQVQMALGLVLTGGLRGACGWCACPSPGSP